MPQLRFCLIQYSPAGCTTWFKDGTHVDATPHPEMPHYHVIAHRCGYGDDLLAYCREHEVAHELVAEWFTDSPSDVLWCLAHNQTPNAWHVVCEETMAQQLQCFVRANERPIISGVDWDGLKTHALSVLDNHANEAV